MIEILFLLYDEIFQVFQALFFILYTNRAIDYPCVLFILYDGDVLIFFKVLITDW